MRSTHSVNRRYLLRFMPLMASYGLLLFVANRMIDSRQVDGPLLALLAALPAIPLLGVMFVIGQYLRDEQDEYRRAQHVTAMLAGTGLLLAVATTWGFLEVNGVMGHAPTFLAFPFWCGAFGLVQGLLVLRDRMAGGGE